MRINIILDQNDNTGYLIETDPRADWMMANGGAQPPDHMHFNNEPIAQTLDAEYAIWIARTGMLKSDLLEIVKVVKDAGSNPMSAIKGIQGIVQRVMGFVGGVDAQVKQLEVVSAKEAERLRRSVAKQRQQQAERERQKSS
jgi:hypothetical protein